MHLAAPLLLVVLAAEPAKVSCRATDEGGALLATATGGDSLSCRVRIKALLRAERCTGGARQVTYWFQRDGGGRAPAVVYCP